MHPQSETLLLVIPMQGLRSWLLPVPLWPVYPILSGGTILLSVVQILCLSFYSPEFALDLFFYRLELFCNIGFPEFVNMLAHDPVLRREYCRVMGYIKTCIYRTF